MNYNLYEVRKDENEINFLSGALLKVPCCPMCGRSLVTPRCGYASLGEQLASTKDHWSNLITSNILRSRLAALRLTSPPFGCQSRELLPLDFSIWWPVINRNKLYNVQLKKIVLVLFLVDFYSILHISMLHERRPSSQYFTLICPAKSPSMTLRTSSYTKYS